MITVTLTAKEAEITMRALEYLLPVMLREGDDAARKAALEKIRKAR